MSRPAPLTFYEFFAGGGMARLGLGEGWRCAFANDFDAVKAATYRQNFRDAEEHFRQGDVWELEANDLPGRADLAWASSPCQDFSLAGGRAGLAGGRSSAFFGFWRLVEALNAEARAPETVVIENVVGLLTSHGGADFTALCQALADQGYRFGAIEIDAARFVPQSRPRVFVVAVRTAPSPNLTQIEPTPPFHGQRVVASFQRLPEALKKSWIWWHLKYPPPGNISIDQVIDSDSESKWLPPQKVARILDLTNYLHAKKLDAAKARSVRTVGTLFRRMRVENKHKVQRAELRFDGVAGCLRMPSGGSSRQFVVVVQNGEVQIRPMSSREAARLMGVGDSYVLPGGTTSALKVLGDGVAVPVVRFLRENLLSPLAERAREIADGSEPTGKVADTR